MNFYRIFNIFIRENVLENVVCEIAAISSSVTSMGHVASGGNSVPHNAYMTSFRLAI